MCMGANLRLRQAGRCAADGCLQGVRREDRTLRVSDYLLKRLADEGIDTAFTVYGGAISEVMDAFTRQSRIRHVCPHHEQAAVFAAEGYSKTKGVPGLVIVTSGPGGGNIVTGLQNAYYDSTPLIAICGQVNSKFIRPTDRVRQLGFQETDMVAIARPITKYARLIRRADEFPAILERAIEVCQMGRPGPVLLEIPGDVAKCSLTI